MKSFTLTMLLAGNIVLGLTAPLFADEATSASKPNVAEKCLNDLRAFDEQMRKDGYWLGGYGETYGYGYGYPFGFMGGADSLSDEYLTGYVNARSGYEIRVLLSAADILARHGRQQACEDVIESTRNHYQQYIAEMEANQMPMADVPGWQRRQIAAAQPVTNTTTAFRSDQLLGVDVRSSQNQALGSVDDLVTSPKTGKIAYVVIARGGWLFGIGAKHVAVPWDDFNIAPSAALLVLNTTKSDMEAAPEVTANELAKSPQLRQDVDSYWKAHIPS